MAHSKRIMDSELFSEDSPSLANEPRGSQSGLASEEQRLKINSNPDTIEEHLQKSKAKECLTNFGQFLGEFFNWMSSMTKLIKVVKAKSSISITDLPRSAFQPITKKVALDIAKIYHDFEQSQMAPKALHNKNKSLKGGELKIESPVRMKTELLIRKLNGKYIIIQGILASCLFLVMFGVILKNPSIHPPSTLSHLHYYISILITSTCVFWSFFALNYLSYIHTCIYENIFAGLSFLVTQKLGVLPSHLLNSRTMRLIISSLLNEIIKKHAMNQERKFFYYFYPLFLVLFFFSMGYISNWCLATFYIGFVALKALFQFIIIRKMDTNEGQRLKFWFKRKTNLSNLLCFYQEIMFSTAADLFVKRFIENKIAEEKATQRLKFLKRLNSMLNNFFTTAFFFLLTLYKNQFKIEINYPELENHFSLSLLQILNMLAICLAERKSNKGFYEYILNRNFEKWANESLDAVLGLPEINQGLTRKLENLLDKREPGEVLIEHQEMNQETKPKLPMANLEKLAKYFGLNKYSLVNKQQENDKNNEKKLLDNSLNKKATGNFRGLNESKHSTHKLTLSKRSLKEENPNLHRSFDLDDNKNNPNYTEDLLEFENSFSSLSQSKVSLTQNTVRLLQEACVQS